jgi:precorrin-6x reductase
MDKDNGYRVVIFGGTTEGRLLAEWCSAHGTAALYCAATELGALSLPAVTARTGRLDLEGMTALLRREKPLLVLDATHPYAAEASGTIAAAAARTGIRRLRVLREESDTEGCRRFTNEDDLVAWLSQTGGMIFAATGLKEARIFTRLPGFAERVYFRLLPGVEGLAACLDLGYPAKNLILMYGPFSRELNRALFAAANAAILVTKDSGDAGGFPEKMAAAADLGMQVALIARPPEGSGPFVSLAGAIESLAALAAVATLSLTGGETP